MFIEFERPEGYVVPKISIRISSIVSVSGNSKSGTVIINTESNGYYEVKGEYNDTLERIMEYGRKSNQSIWSKGD